RRNLVVSLRCRRLDPSHREAAQAEDDSAALSSRLQHLLFFFSTDHIFFFVVSIFFSFPAEHIFYFAVSNHWIRYFYSTDWVFLNPALRFL
uniref:Uncharacterized protein n=1 Tax=Oryza brachyantha TaxID=4533 RepID=J3LVC1_ORYBR